LPENAPLFCADSRHLGKPEWLDSKIGRELAFTE